MRPKNSFTPHLPDGVSEPRTSPVAVKPSLINGKVMSKGFVTVEESLRHRPTAISEATNVRWEMLQERYRDLLPLFADLRLNMSATKAAKACGLLRADVLGRELLARRLPPFRLLRDWYYVAQITARFAGGESIAHWAMSRGDNPSQYYRLVKVVTGRGWSVVTTKGILWVRQRAMDAWAPHVSGSNV